MLSLTATGYVTGTPVVESGDYGDFCPVSIRCKGDGGKHVFYVNAKFYGRKMDTITKYIKDGDQITITGTVTNAMEKAKKDGTKYTQVFMNGAGFALPARAPGAPMPAPRQPEPAAEEEDDVPF